MAAHDGLLQLRRAIRALHLATAFLWPMSITVTAQASTAPPPFGASAGKTQPPPTGVRTLDNFESLAPWIPVTSTQVTAKLRLAPGVEGHALCMDYDFHGVSGYVGITRVLPMDYPSDYAFSFQLRGDSPSNDLQFKLVDASGDNVWWVQRPRYVFPKDWTPIRYKKRHVSKAWGPSPETELTHSAKLEFTLASGDGGKGTVCFDALRFEPLAPDDGSPLRATTTNRAGAAALDGREDTIWHGRFADRRALVMDLGRVREFGGLSLQWSAQHTSDYDLSASNDGATWKTLRSVHGGNGGRDWLALPESEARYLRLTPLRGPLASFGLAEAVVEPLAFAATSNDFIKSVAAISPRGDWPRGFSGEQPYWTIVGVDGGKQQGLISEDGAIELGKGGPSIEPFVLVDGKRVGWPDVTTAQSLQDGYLPIPSVDWVHPEFGLKVTAFGVGAAGDSRLVARYRLTNTGATARDYDLLLALRPLQVNPPSQFLNTAGGFSPLCAIDADQEGVRAGKFHAGLLAPEWEVAFAPAATDVAGFWLGNGDLPGAIDRHDWSSRATVDDQDCLAGVAWRHRVRLAPGESREFAWSAPLDTPVHETMNFRDPIAPGVMQARTAAQWHARLDAVQVQVPAQGQRMLRSLRTALANMLISRSGPRLQPGTRSYARAWIRDGAMIAEALSRMGRSDVAADFVRWYAPYQFDDGKVPCCVDDRGADPVPENDSHGELLFAIAEAYRYNGDRALLESTWPNTVKAVAYMDQLRASERTDANRAINPAFYGMMPASISHEGYSAKPMHSYWDNFWALRGYKDAVQIARWLGHEKEAASFAASRDQFAADLRASLAAATASKHLDYIPGSAELGDFDPTSTTIALAPADAEDLLPGDLLQLGFDRYWRESQSRADGTRAWKDYTPYETRTIGTFVRLGQPERAKAMLDFFLAGQQPTGWNQWAEVVSSTPRKPFFLGDLPHAWVASDYVRSVLDMFAYLRERDDAIVIGAGIPLDWLDGDGVGVSNLRVPGGALAYRLRRAGNRITLELPVDARRPPAGLVLRLPLAKVMAARVDGEAVEWRDGELLLPKAAMRVELRLR
ncbi:discoidin domain-containing protein [soil metagenome]